MKTLLLRSICRLTAQVIFSAVLAGCGHAAFGGAMPGYDQSACVENALRNNPSKELLARAGATFAAACRDGEAESCSALGVMHELGLGGSVDSPGAVSLYRMACTADHARGCVNLGSALERGVGIERDVRHAEALYTRACEANEMFGCAQLGRMKLAGTTRGGAVDETRGRALLQRACSARVRSACRDYAEALTRGNQLHDALLAYTSACLQGDSVACQRMDGPTIRTSGEAAAGWRSGSR